MNKKILGSAIGIGLLAAGVFFAWNYFHTPTNEYLPVDHVITISGKQIQVRVADTEAKQVQGLSGFTTLPPDQGMFFVFNKLDYYAFWMKDMQFPLDIVWMKRVSSNRYQVIGIMQNVSPSTYPQVFRSPEPVDGFLELPAYTVDTSIVGNELVLNKK
jgi:uncharacterized membrane protein (UPF0127 family)